MVEKSTLNMIYTFEQMYYLFMHSRLNINKNKMIAKFGLMHLLVESDLENPKDLNYITVSFQATNCCIWIRTLVR